ncbi:hypothetical protein HDU96_011076 [Phlyctochytrium bullatum]|nr:hypothetical protein HDU96_011076 [Phlyctochytrium bullatum]
MHHKASLAASPAASRSTHPVCYLMNTNFELDGLVARRYTRLHAAARFGLRGLMLKLIVSHPKRDQWTYVNLKDRRGWTPLHWAASEGHLEAAKLLIAHGASVSAGCGRWKKEGTGPTNAGGRAALDSKWVLEVPRHSDGLLALHVAGDAETVRALLEIGANPNGAAGKYHGATPLHWAVTSGGGSDAAEPSEKIRALLEKGARPTAALENGDTALHAACKAGTLPWCLTALVAGLCDNETLDPVRKDGWTPLHEAAKSGNAFAARYLIDRGAKIEAIITNEELTPLHVAAKYGKNEVVRLLLEKGAKLDARMSLGSTAVHTAALNGFKEVLETLFDAAAEREGALDVLMGPDRSGHTALHNAAMGGKDGVVGLLLQRGLDPMARNKDGKTAADLAAEKGHSGVTSLLEA